MAINVSQPFHRTSANAVDDTLTLTKAEMLAVNDNLMPSKYLTVCQDDGFIYLYDKTNTVDGTTGKFRKFEGGGGATYTAGDGINIDNDEISTDNMQSGDIADVTYPLPTPGTGVTTLGGLSDVAISDPQANETLVYNSTTHAWENGEGGKTYTGGDGINIDANDEISTDNMQSGDMEEVISTLPGIQSKYHKYSTTEQIVGEWIDGSKIYEKTFVINNPTDNSTIQTGVANIVGCTNLVWISNVGVKTWSNCGWFSASDNYTIRFQIPSSSTDLKVRVTVNTSGLTITKLYATLIYTKA